MAIGAGALAAMLGVQAGGDVLNAFMQNSASNNAATQAEIGQGGALAALSGGQQSAYGALAPYLTGGQSNYDFLQYLLGAGAPTTNAWTPDQEAQLQQAQQNLALFQGSSRYTGKNPGVLEAAQNQVTALQAAKQAAEAGTAGGAQITSSGLPQGYLTQSYNPATDQSFTGAFNVAADEINAKAASTGSYGSGNVASSLLNESALLEPEFEQLFTGRQNQLYNYLTGNTGGAGQNVATNLAGVYTGGANNMAPYIAGSGNAAASGTMGGANAYTNAFNNMMGQTNSLAGLYLTQQQLAKYFGNGAGNGTAASLYANPGTMVQDPYTTGLGVAAEYGYY